MKLHNGLVDVRVFKSFGAGFAEVTIGSPHNALGSTGLHKPGEILTLRFTIDRSLVDYVVPVTTNRDKTEAWPVREVVRDGVTVFEHDVPLLPKGVDNQKNIVRLLVMSNKGQVESRNFAIICQRNEFYIAPQTTYRVQVYRTAEGKVVAPGLYNADDGKGSFVGVQSLIEAHYKPQFALPPVSSYTTSTLPDYSKLLGDNDMVVLSWSLSKNTGVGLRKDGASIKLHYSQVNVAVRTPVYLEEGEVITAHHFGKVPDARQGQLDTQGFQMTRTGEMFEDLLAAASQPASC